MLLEGELPRTILYILTTPGQEVQKLDASFKTLIDAEASIGDHQKALRQVALQVGQRTLSSSAKELYTKEVKKGKMAYEAKTTRQKYAKNNLYGSFREDIWNARHPEEPMDPIINSIPREEGDEEDEDDFEVGGTTQDLKCPLSLTLFEDPVTAKKCKHSFSKKSINEYLHGRPKECPATGCHEIISPHDLEVNRGLEFRVKARIRREKEKAEENENIEIESDEE
ncbi:zinc-finger of the MIZ type in Nse subunit-domain-containing protein [Cantharellus anzutake]|uniref:zinc-finger of the MIZ type in Nse subunit-domain-containing protein n=1 Tax=Cantharellus anzutake TaxID=1750568 RepID=UPI0019037A11|nr:zinc-finger of the MIZ type in Nse subunit-domain-containing protein [Cantharellus anzutake]KAF8326967.1 zinc-finger of the MIZ type in Nse subunit-domain-containing protein [Cantharellus anzutake]